MVGFVSRKKPFGQRKKYVYNIKSLLFEKLWMAWETITHYAKYGHTLGCWIVFKNSPISAHQVLISTHLKCKNKSWIKPWN